MENNWKDIIGAASGDEAHVLGKFLLRNRASLCRTVTFATTSLRFR